jgi:hypothetical protein
MNVEDVKTSTMLIHLGLARCGLTRVRANINVTMVNLHNLDLSHNLLTTLHLQQLVLFPLLRELTLCGNPLTLLIKPSSPQHALRQLDLTYLTLTTLNTDVLNSYPNLLALNLSHSGLEHVTGEGLRNLTKLRDLDVCGCSLSVLPGNGLLDMIQLESVRTDNYRLCCAQMLPAGFMTDNCHSPPSLLSSCQSLLGSMLHRVSVAVLAALCLTGNTFMLLWSFLSVHGANTRSQSVVRVMLKHLAASDMLVGVCLGVIGVADRLHDGAYVLTQDAWLDSVACSVTAVVWTTAHNVSVVVLCSMTVDCGMALTVTCRQRRWSLTPGGAHVIGVVAWVVSGCLATIQLLPVTSNWRVYSTVGLCFPLPVAALHASASSHAFSLGVIVVFSCSLLAVVALGSIIVYAMLPSQIDLIAASAGLDTKNTDKSEDSSDAIKLWSKNFQTDRFLAQVAARRLLPLSLCGTLLWLPTCVCVLLQQSVALLPLTDQQLVTLLLLTMPLRSALNPLLYWMGYVREKRGQMQRKRLVKWLGFKTRAQR